ncbi:zinc carboxypeptidase family protein (macronuclear) [Tetrahymena thermophila SB210]|uniref:Zinc carboxypeptidase family protein n=1 Tax=Tetrahymena thermophila (strain SB210) TaxID=312017 RepID=Q23A36_TETTS|nr:zinc carboxypeptidase family protein [Tetrahymena thermophila SB210]EAR93444.2 zinc carboxypeptidase family protein [Tetrahymena thermophila SB210]|eukprot:XP_001013689.2 zinc carboxypeptidase family protein [Tetrahymena thermophila SB210]
MINHALDLPLGKDLIIKQYQQISQIQQLRSLIIENKNNKLDSSVEQKFKNFISELELKKDQNTEQLQKLLEKSTQQQQLVNYEYPNMIKQQIFSFIDKINFFDSDLINNTNSNSRDQPQKLYNICDKLLPLISNKSNYCSDDFLNFVRSQLEKLDCLFEKFCNENMFQQGKEPIKFDQINEQKMNDINEYVNHQIQLQNDQNYLFQIQQSPFIQDIEKIVKSKINFLNLDSQQILSEYFKETYPFVKNNLNIQQFYQKENFQLLNSINEETINDLLLLLKEKQLIANNEKQSQTFKIKDNPLFRTYKSYELERILKEFPIFDIIQKKKDQIDILKDLQLIKSQLNDGDKRIFIQQIIDQNSIEINLNEENYQGQNMVLEQGSIVECRIWLGGQIFQILDYPKYDCQVTLENERLAQLSIIDDFKFFLLVNSNIQYAITDAFIVEDFNS